MPSEEGLETLRADVATFASSLGFGSVGWETGFNDVDFRKIGSINPKKIPDIGNKNPFQGRRAKGEDGSVEKQSLSTTRDEVNGKRKFAESKSRDVKKRKLYSSVHKADEKHGGTSFNESKAAGSFKRTWSNPYQRDLSKEIESNVSVKNCSKTFSKVWNLLKSGSWYDAVAALLRTGENMDGLGLKLTQSSQHDGQVEDTPIKPNMVQDWNKLAAEIRRKGENLMEKATAHYEKSRGKDSDMRWLTIARRTGTTADKVAALTVLIQDNPVANLKALDSLLGMVTSKGGKRHAAMGIDALKEMFGTSLLPDRKLKYLIHQPLQLQWDSQDKDILSLLWYWEDCLKHRYEQFVLALEEAAKDKLPFLKEKAVKTMYELLKAKPEQERRLLSAIVNKLGDPERKVASNAGYFLSCLLTQHPNMKMVVIEEVDCFVFRPHLGLRSQYQAVVFLNQMVLSSKGQGPQLAKRLIDIYFSLFKVITAGELKDVHIRKKNERKATRQRYNKKLEDHYGKDTDIDSGVEIDSRILSALLSGVNRAFPFVVAEDVDILIEEHTPTLFRLVHSKSFNVGVQALMLLYQLLAKNQTASDRLYRALYTVLLSPELAKSSKVEMFFGLLFKAIKSDINSKRMAAFAKRLMQVALQQAPQFTCGCLLLLSEVLKSRPTLWSAVTQTEDGDEENEHFHDVTDELATSLDIPDHVNKYGLDRKDIGTISSFRTEAFKEMGHSSDSDKEIHCIVPDLGDEDSSSAEDGKDKQTKKKVHNKTILYQNVSAAQEVLKASLSNPVSCTDEWPKTGSYNPRLREPSFCNADQACWWELTALASHVHPSVAAMAKTLLSGASISYAGDPLKDLALGVFLDRFAEKKPKPRRKSGIWHGSTLCAPTRKASTSNTLPVGIEFFQLSEREVAPEDILFYKFYTSKLRKRKAKCGKGIESKAEITRVDKGEDFLDGDNSDDDEVEDLLEQDEGIEIGLTESSEDNTESDGELSYEQMGEALQKVNGEVSIELKNRERKPCTTLTVGSDGGEFDTEHHMVDKVRGFRNTFVVGTDKGPKEKSNVKEGKTTKIFGEKTTKKSPFASLDDYCYLLNDESLGGMKGNMSPRIQQKHVNAKSKFSQTKRHPLT